MKNTATVKSEAGWSQILAAAASPTNLGNPAAVQSILSELYESAVSNAGDTAKLRSAIEAAAKALCGQDARYQPTALNTEENMAAHLRSVFGVDTGVPDRAVVQSCVAAALSVMLNSVNEPDPELAAQAALEHWCAVLRGVPLKIPVDATLEAGYRLWR